MASDLPQVRFGLIERALSVFSPDAARRRYDSRIHLATKRRLYDAAVGAGGTGGWIRRGKSSADSEISMSGGTLRERSRDLARNSPLAAQAVQVLVNNLIGPGIRPRARSGSKARDKKVDKLFEAWSKVCDAHGHTDFYGLQALAVREMIEGGDVFGVKRPLPRGRRRTGIVPLEVELFEAEHLDEGKQSLASDGGLQIREGIEYGADGRRSALWLLPEHPGDAVSGWLHGRESVRVPVAHAFHLFERRRVQSRGTPWGVPAMLAMRDHGDWQRAELVRKKTEACLVGVVIGEDESGSSEISPVEDAEGNVVERFSPGMIAYARGGKSIEFNQPSGAGGVAEWNRVQLHIIAAGYRVPYALMTGDLSQANFSSNRAGLNEFRRMIDQLQWQMIIPMLCQPIWDWFCDAAFTAGLIDTPSVGVEWATPRFESVNPKQDAETDLLEVRAGFASRSQKVSSRGFDPLQVAEEIGRDNEEADRLGLILDSDPRRATKQGLSPDPSAGQGAKDPENGSKPQPQED